MPILHTAEQHMGAEVIEVGENASGKMVITLQLKNGDMVTMSTTKAYHDGAVKKYVKKRI